MQPPRRAMAVRKHLSHIGKVILCCGLRLTCGRFDSARRSVIDLSSCSLSWLAFLQASAGDPIPEQSGRGERWCEPSARSLSGPSPTANLAGIWKGDPLPRRVAGITISRFKALGAVSSRPRFVYSGYEKLEYRCFVKSTLHWPRS